MSIVIKEIFSFRHSHIMLLFSRLVISNSLPHWLQHARLLCPSPFPRVCSNLGPLSWWCHLTISSSVILFSSHLLSSLAWGSFLMSWLCIRWLGASASASVLAMSSQGWFPLGLTGLVSLQPKALWRVSNITVQKHQFFGIQPSLWSNSHIHRWLLEKPWLWLYGPLSAK